MSEFEITDEQRAIIFECFINVLKQEYKNKKCISMSSSQHWSDAVNNNVTEYTIAFEHSEELPINLDNLLGDIKYEQI